ncbi:MAG: FMN-binding protein [Alkalispirochaetaceae bacterium]
MTKKRKLFTVKNVLIWIGALILGFGLSMISFGVPKQDHTLRHVATEGMPDGRYEAEYKVVAPFGTFVANKRFTVAVELADGSITAVSIMEPEKMTDAFPELEARILQEQTTALDAVSGATWSKIAYLKAAESALRSASK